VTALEAPAWVENNLKRLWPELKRRVTPELLPNVAEEYGCGHYGCVMPTVGAGTGQVVKLTSDVLEGLFIVHMMHLRQPEEGLVHYHRIIGVSGRRYGRPLFLIWRQEAKHVGLLWNALSMRSTVPGWQKRAYEEGADYLRAYTLASKDIRNRLEYVIGKRLHSNMLYGAGRAAIYAPVWNAWLAKRKRGLEILWRDMPSVYENILPYSNDVYRILKRHRGLDRIEVALEICRQSVEMLANTDQWYKIGNALSLLLEEGFVLADIHYDNIGLDDDNYLIITDPGHAAPFNPKLATVPRMEIIR
jgi:hypothetical protein